LKILVINTKFLGDLILSTPGLRSLRKKYPDAEITLLVRKGYEEAMRNNPHINRIIPFDFGVKGKSPAGRISAEIKFLNQIRKEQFDAVISLHPGDRIAFLSRVSNAKIRIAPRKQPFSFLFNLLVNVEEDTISYLDYYNKLISAFINEEVEGKTEFFITEKDKNWGGDFLGEAGINSSDLLIGIHPGASEPTKIWPAENFSGLIGRLQSVDKIKILLVGGPKENEIVERIAGSVDAKNLRIYNSDDINRTAALMERTRLFIANDTATRHLAVALKIPVIALMPDDNQKCWNFYKENDNHFVISGRRAFPAHGSPYLAGITEEVVFGKVLEILKK
jgi:ADP-heptose:LPS heptosyltransferase